MRSKWTLQCDVLSFFAIVRSLRVGFRPLLGVTSGHPGFPALTKINFPRRVSCQHDASRHGWNKTAATTERPGSMSVGLKL